MIAASAVVARDQSETRVRFTCLDVRVRPNRFFPRVFARFVCLVRRASVDRQFVRFCVCVFVCVRVFLLRSSRLARGGFCTVYFYRIIIIVIDITTSILYGFTCFSSDSVWPTFNRSHPVFRLCSTNSVAQVPPPSQSDASRDCDRFPVRLFSFRLCKFVCSSCSAAFALFDSSRIQALVPRCLRARPDTTAATTRSSRKRKVSRRVDV